MECAACVAYTLLLYLLLLLIQLYSFNAISPSDVVHILVTGELLVHPTLYIPPDHCIKAAHYLLKAEKFFICPVYLVILRTRPLVNY